MGKATGFIEYSRKTASYRAVADRLKDYKDVATQLPVETLAEQGARCMDCGIPFCHAMGCPVVNLIPEWNDLIYRGKWKEALHRLELTNNLPEITGRICPAPCESSCTLSINSEPVTIKQIELAIVEKGFAEGWIVPRPPICETGKKVAVIGSGPAGLAAVQQLRRMGHKVTLFEKNKKLGGILRYGIPDFKLEKWIIDRRVEQMRAEGVVFETDVHIGDDLSARYLQRKFDAILLTVGAGEPRDLTVPGRGLEGIHFAMDYLCGSNRLVAGEIKESEIINAKGKNVLVVGGGDTGSDCVGTANRQGVKKVTQIEIMPKPLDWKEPWNPNWPDWPTILRTSSSHDEGCIRDWAVQTKKCNGKGVKVENVECSRVEWVKDSSGRTSPKELAGSDFVIDADLVIIAMGFVHVKHDRLLEEFGTALDERGNVKTTQYQSSVKGIFAAGDAGTGASLVVRAIYHGREAAKAMDSYLMGK